MKKISIKTIYLLCSVILSIFSLIGINMFIKSKVDPQQVWVFTRDLSVNTKISDGDVTTIEIPKDAIKPGFFIGNGENIIGKCVNADVLANQYVFQKHLVEPSDVDPYQSIDKSTLRKISIKGTMVDTSGQIKKGDTIDLIYYSSGRSTSEDDRNSTFQYGKVFMQNVPVYEVVTANGTKTTGPQDVPEGTDYNPFYEYIVVAVTMPQAEEILTRMKYGDVGVIGRFKDSQSYATNGFAIGNVPSLDRIPFIGEAQVENKEPLLVEPLN